MALTSEAAILPTPHLHDSLHPQIVQDDREAHSHCHDLHNDISQQTKQKEELYIPREWATTKLTHLKSSSTLNTHTQILPNSIQVHNNTLTTQLTQNNSITTALAFHFFNDGIIKLNCQNPTNPSKFSFELLEKPANLTPYDITSRFTTTESHVEVSMPEVNLRFFLEFNPFTVKLFSSEKLLFEVNGNKSLLFDENLAADFTFHTEHLYGLAEHASGLQLQDTRQDLPYRFCNQDIPMYPLNSKNALYGTIPLIISRSKDSSTLVSMYWQNSSDTYVDIHKEGPTKAFWVSERGNLECYLFVSHSNAVHFKSLSHVFGHCAMPQYFSLGYHQCRWSYKDQADVLHVNGKFNEHEIPCDSITLDIDHTDECRYFTWNSQLFPDPLAMQKALADDKRQLVTIADPHIKVDDEYHVYKEAVERELYVKTGENTPFVGKCWPGDSIWLDFLNEEARQSWASQYSYDKYKNSSSNVWAWNDMNEPSVFEYKGNHMPLENLHTFKTVSEPEKAFQIEHREVHNLYGYGQHKATYEGMLNRNPCKNVRPHVLSRSFYAGSQKWTTVWTGDTGATWEYLQVTVPQLLSLSLCGISFCGGDVGGFLGDPEPELAVRWYQLGAFMPYFRAHSEINTKRREPWLFEKKNFEIIKESIKERYRLLPYWYSCFEEHCRTAVPVLRPVWFDQEKVTVEENMNEEERFMVGSGLLVVPIVKKDQKSIKAPTKGLEGRWYDYYSKKEVVGDNEVMETGLERIGCFVKGGSVIPSFDIRSYVKSSKDAKESNINLVVAVDEEEKAKGSMYFDDGETFNYRKGECCRKNVEFEKNTLVWKGEENSGEFNPGNRVTKVVIMGLKEKVKEAYLVEEGKGKKKVTVERSDGFVTVEFVTFANRNWKIVLE